MFLDMTPWILAFLIGVDALTFLSRLPPVFISWVGLVSGSVLLIVLPQRFLYWLKLPIACGLGFAWALLSAHSLLSWTLPTALAGKNVAVIGTIATIPEQKGDSLSFEMDAEQLKAEDFVSHKPVRIRLSWYRSPVLLQVGDRWQLTVRLKPPRGFWNVGSFDYEAWLLEHRVRVVGYVVAKGNNHLLSSNRFEQSINRVREHLAQGIVESLHERPLLGLISALAVGVRDRITEPQWAVLRSTGTNHLFAIAGLHIGFVSGMIYALVSFIWRRLGRLPLYFATPQVAALGALISAVIYSALAGFAMPTQRAIIMIAVFLLATLLRKNLPPWTAWNLALFTILMIEPLAVLSDSFWLSFGAVALIIYGSGGRLKVQGLWWRWGHVQWVIAFGLIPLSLLFFHQVSLAGFIANAIAIPWVGFITLPLSLLGDIAGLLSPTIGTALWRLAEDSLGIIWPLLAHIAALDELQWIAYLNNPWIFFSAIVAVALLLAPRGFPARWLGFIWFLPLLLWVPAGPRMGELEVIQLDVGRGLAAIIRTAHHTLVYDTGPGFNSGFNAGEAVLIPVLRLAGIRKIDALIMSDGSNGHIGGAASLLSQIPTRRVITRVPLFFPPNLAITCQAGQRWQWDEINFQILDDVCSLLVSNGKESIVVSNKRVRSIRYSANIVVTVGTVNRGTKIYSTVAEGAIRLKLKPQGTFTVETFHSNQRHFWNG